jgi:hypothetical protein
MVQAGNHFPIRQLSNVGPWGVSSVGGLGGVFARVVTIIDLLPITIIDGSRGLHTAEVPVASSLYSGLSFPSLLSLGGGTGNAALISLRPSLITEHHFVSILNDLAPNLAPHSAQFGLGMANGQPRALGSEGWFRCAPCACKDALASRKRRSDQ